MGKINLDIVVVGLLQTNCYIVYDSEVKEAVIVDPGATSGAIKSKISDLGVKPVAILLTHGHADHIGALKKIKDEYRIPVYVHEDEVELLRSPMYNLSADGYELAADDVTVKDGQKLKLGGMDIKVIHTPGHTPGGCCFYIEDADLLLAGDTMFRFSWGRTDFPGGSEVALMSSIRNKLLPLPEETQVYPGHDMPTVIKDERRLHGYNG